MAVAIRLRRMGKKKAPAYRVVAADNRNKRDGRFIEILGTYNPIAPGGTEFTLKEERITHWLGVGAQPSDTVRSILKKAGMKLPGSGTHIKKKETA